MTPGVRSIRRQTSEAQ